MTVNITLDEEAETAFKPVRLIMEITSPEALSSIKKLAALDVSIPKLVAEKSSNFSFSERTSLERFLAQLQAVLYEAKR